MTNYELRITKIDIVSSPRLAASSPNRLAASSPRFSSISPRKFSRVSKILAGLLPFLLLVLTACSPTPSDVTEVHEYPPIYPDYINVTVPVNIAPLNFLLRVDGCDAMVVKATAPASATAPTIYAKCKGNEATFDIKEWRNLLENCLAQEITLTVTARINGKWLQYSSFDIYVVDEPIDPYLTYRLIEPDYEVFSRLQIQERNLENFDTRNLVDYESVGNRCMNCHTYGSNSGNLSFLYVRGEGGGMILNQDGHLRKLSVKADDMVSGAVYAQLSPSGRYLVFSTNVIIPGFHSCPAKRLEVFDTKSGVYVADLQTDRIIRSPLLADSACLETFPTFSPDGKSIYFCTAQGPGLPKEVEGLQYSLCRVDFDESSGTVGTQVDTIVAAKEGTKSSVSHPRISPDSRFLLYCVADYGTFPIWHPEADLRMLNLSTGEIDSLEWINSEKSDTYHSWSSDGRWFVFASKRDDGMYGKPYICHVDDDGEVSKPFVVPQKYPTFYDHNLKSYNVPELGKTPVRFSAEDVAEVLNQPAETFR